ncbi:MAG TPA: GFA family protein, partial [Pseudolabrys sp.]|nr:GFA family protein [Pseudolabrys sp.]
MKPDFKLPLTGRCQCRSVAYKITAAPLAVYACHCTECQRQSGSAFSLSLLADRGAVVVEEGQPAVWERQHESGRVIDCVICAKCGSRLFHEPRANTKITIVKA